MALLLGLTLSCEAFGAVITEAARRQVGSATGATQAKHAAALAAEEKLTGGGSSGGGGSAPASRGADLRAIASPKKGNTSFTGFPSGTLPGDGGEGSGGEGEQEEKKPALVAMVGDPLLEPISEANVGNGLDRIGAIADHVGYHLVMRHRYQPRSPRWPR